eukprot:TRINITY_DN52825_c0_g1_i1.p1 TRINITY_DN52825_c0_g1~~TRINITY_DN52825_c0_g1_i1.p1  ORF type:complete len:973 (+),score=148.90 TRINITY_DN52825_c0_g1_i1:243-2921(+)
MKAEEEMEGAMAEFYKHYTKSGFAKKQSPVRQASPPPQVQPSTPSPQKQRESTLPPPRPSPFHAQRVAAEADVNKALEALGQSMNSSGSGGGGGGGETTLESLAAGESEADIQYLLDTPTPSVIQRSPWPDRTNTPIYPNRVVAQIEADLAIADMERQANTPSPALQHSIFVSERRASPEMKVLQSTNESLKQELQSEKHAGELRETEIYELTSSMTYMQQGLTELRAQFASMKEKLAKIPECDVSVTDTISGQLESQRLSGEVAALQDTCQQRTTQLTTLRTNYEEAAKEGRDWEEKAALWRQEAQESTKNLQYWSNKARDMQKALDRSITERFAVQKEVGYAKADAQGTIERIARIQREEEDLIKADEMTIKELQSEGAKAVELAEREVEHLRHELTSLRKQAAKDDAKWQQRKERSHEILQTCKKEVEEGKVELEKASTKRDALKRTYHNEVEERQECLESIKRLTATAKHELEKEQKRDTQLGSRKRAAETQVEHLERQNIPDPKRLQAELNGVQKRVEEENAREIALAEEKEKLEAELKHMAEFLERRDAELDEDVIEAEQAYQKTKQLFKDMNTELDTKLRRQVNNINNMQAERKMIRKSLPGIESDIRYWTSVINEAGDFLVGRQAERDAAEEARKKAKEAELAALKAEYEAQAKEEAKKRAEAEGIPWVDPDESTQEAPAEGGDITAETQLADTTADSGYKADASANPPTATSELDESTKDASGLPPAMVDGAPADSTQQDVTATPAGASVADISSIQGTPASSGTVDLAGEFEAAMNAPPKDPNATPSPDVTLEDTGPPPTPEVKAAEAMAADLGAALDAAETPPAEAPEEKKETALDKIAEVDKTIEEEKDKQAADLQAKLAAKKAKKEALKKKLAEGGGEG